MKRSLFLGAALALAATPALAATWTIDPAASKITFKGSQTGAAFDGHFSGFKGTIDFDPAKPEAGHAEIVIDTKSAATGDTQRDEALPQEDWFNVAKFPEATFTVKSFKAKGGDAYDALGTLTIRGLSKDLTLPFTLAIDGTTAHAKGHVDLKRNDYGVGQGAWNVADYVAFEVGVDIDITAKAAP